MSEHMTKKDIRRIERLANISNREYAELDKMIAAAIELKGQDVQIKLGRTLEHVPISGLGTVRFYCFPWAIGDDVRGIVAWRQYGDEEGVAAFQACAAKYFSDGVKAKSVVMEFPDGHTEQLRPNRRR